jgi:hypothetical protein
MCDRFALWEWAAGVGDKAEPVLGCAEVTAAAAGVLLEVADKHALQRFRRDLKEAARRP